MSSNASFIIPNFFHTVQTAAIALVTYKSVAATTQNPASAAHNQAIKKIACQHLIGAAIMTTGVMIGLAALPYMFTATLGFALLAALGVATYAIGHDVFVMANNAKKPPSALQTLYQAIASAGEPQHVAQAKAKTDGTLFQPLIVTKILAKQTVAIGNAAASTSP